LAELIEYLARQLVDEPEVVRVDTEEGTDAVLFRLHVAPADRGKVIGRGGRLVRSLRTVVRAGGARDDRRYVLELAGD
jgi:predicted RNA-binding protein YlqC (UPF0109 family)